MLSGLSAAKLRALAIADNRITEGASWDRRRLAIEIPELTELLSVEELDISILGFEPIEIEQIRLESEAPAGRLCKRARPLNDIDPGWGEKAAVSRRGDLWILGPHKLLCGDGRSMGDLVRLMGDDRADVAFIDLASDNRADDAEDGVRRALDAAAASCRDAIQFVFTNRAGVGDLVVTAKGNGWRLLDVVAWVKPDPVEGAIYSDQYEPIGVVEIGSFERPRRTQKQGTRQARSNVWRYPSRTLLPSTFPDALRTTVRLVPVALIVDAIKDCSRRNDIVLGSSCGAGAMIMAAQEVVRRARCVERDPLLVDVAIRRWQVATGQDAFHEESRSPFNAVEADRAKEHDGGRL